jgi:hypothetical protein
MMASKEITVRGPNTTPDSIMATNDMLRFEFIELLVRIAKAKYIDTNLQERYYNALDEFFEVDLKRYVRYLNPTTSFRQNELYNIEVNDLFHANLDGLKKVYNSLCIKPRKNMNFNDSMILMTSYNL